MKLRRLPILARIPTAGRLLLLAAVLLASISLPPGVRAAETRRDPVWGGVVKDPPGWLSMSGQVGALDSAYEFEGVAGHLINGGTVDASACPNGGLKTDGEANGCGLKAALPKVVEWQNQFDAAILATSQRTSVPPILMKNIFAWESQLWPVTVYVNTSEFGLGHLTEMGADSALRWNPSFYAEVCAKSFAAENCEKAYGDQPLTMQSALRGVVVQQVRADCGTCAYGLDLSLAKSSTDVFAQVLLANAHFVRLAIQGTTGKSAADVLTYEDFWKFTLASYNAGPGCFSAGLQRTVGDHAALEWRNLAARLEPGCRGSIPYVKFVSDTTAYRREAGPGAAPSPTATLAPGTGTATPGTVTPSPSQTTGTPTLTATPAGTETPSESATETPAPSGTPEATATASLTKVSTPTETLAGTATDTPAVTPTPTGDLSDTRAHRDRRDARR